MNDRIIRASVMQFSDSLLIGLLALAFALSDGFAQLILGIAFLAAFAAFVANGLNKKPGTPPPPADPD
ncbi:hypothetical protein [Pseudomarimonas salicorniae]|uniref:Uncharacterized protein n=1 Tax=Pseudomarimonas salicorniae TaxID=2933270 RepID=A0ABT0GEP4_9GAMM|nr:hypothetical protein [Lysobacter sp. CAU 1642]MCK7593019.1 hypothetical protein [Lysobacter sp. CAU 1642]